MRIRKEDMFNLENVLSTTSDLKTAKLNQSRKQLLQDQANMENEAYGNFLAKDKPNSMVQPIDANQDGMIDDNERRTAVRQTGMQMNAFNQIENLGNRRENRQIAASNRARVANDRVQKKATQAELTSMLTDSLTKAGVDKDTIKMIALGGSKEVKQLNAAMKTMEAKEKAQIKDQVEKQGNILGYVAKATSGKSTQEQNAVMETMLSQVNPKERPHTKKLMTDKDGNYSHAITFANMALLGKIGDDDGQSANSKAVDRRQERTLNASKQKEAKKQKLKATQNTQKAALKIVDDIIENEEAYDFKDSRKMKTIVKRILRDNPNMNEDDAIDTMVDEYASSKSKEIPFGAIKGNKRWDGKKWITK